MDTDYLLDQVARGNHAAAETLLARHRKRLRHMIALRIDPRLTARLDPSDIVQDAMGIAHCRLREFALSRPIPFYPWLRRIAWDRLLQMHRHHIDAKRRTVRREDQLPLSSQWQGLLAERLTAATLFDDEIVRQEMCARVREAIDQLPEGVRETVVLRHLEELSFEEVAAVQELSLAATYSRYYRAINKLHRLLNDM
jgi:RNA polymerase sigma-70 factor (ECF subfamily)